MTTITTITTTTITTTHDHDHDHHHVVTAEQTGGDWREQLGVVLAVGLRPCSGALVVLVFALSQGLLAAGIAAVFLMGLGTAHHRRGPRERSRSAPRASRSASPAPTARSPPAIVWWAELLGAVLVFGFGVVLLLASL